MTFARLGLGGLSILAALTLAAQAAAEDEEPRAEAIALGYIEDVAVGNSALAMTAKLDTGADTSSVHAYNIKVYNRSERDHWVKFRLIGKDGRAVRYDQNVIRFARIKTKTGGLIRRPVIRLPLCVGGKWGKAEINLADRGDFEYEILIGREFLANRVLVDSGRTFVSDEECEQSDED